MKVTFRLPHTFSAGSGSGAWGGGQPTESNAAPSCCSRRTAERWTGYQSQASNKEGRTCVWMPRKNVATLACRRCGRAESSTIRRRDVEAASAALSAIGEVNLDAEQAARTVPQQRAADWQKQADAFLTAPYPIALRFGQSTNPISSAKGGKHENETNAGDRFIGPGFDRAGRLWLGRRRASHQARVHVGQGAGRDSCHVVAL